MIVTRRALASRQALRGVAPGVAVCGTPRLRCGARYGVAPQNSLRSAPLKQLRRVRQRSALRAPTPSLRGSKPHRSPHRTAPAAKLGAWELGTGEDRPRSSSNGTGESNHAVKGKSTVPNGR